MFMRVSIIFICYTVVFATYGMRSITRPLARQARQKLSLSRNKLPMHSDIHKKALERQSKHEIESMTIFIRIYALNGDLMCVLPKNGSTCGLTDVLSKDKQSELLQDLLMTWEKFYKRIVVANKQMVRKKNHA